MSLKKKVLIAVGSVVLAAAIFASAVVVSSGGFGQALKMFKSEPDTSSISPDQEIVPEMPDNVGSANSQEQTDKVKTMYSKGAENRSNTARLFPSDFFKPGDSADAVHSKLKEIFAKYTTYRFDSVIMPVYEEDKTLFLSEYFQRLSSDIDLLGIAIQTAHDSGLRFFVQWNAAMPFEKGKAVDLTSEADSKRALQNLEALCTYSFDGIFIENLTLPAEASSYITYLGAGGGMGYSAYRADKLSLSVKKLTSSIAARKSEIIIGLIAPSVWATKPENPAGISLASNTDQSLRDHSSDTLGWLEKGLFNAVIVDSTKSISDKERPFKTVCDWWVTNTPDNIALYFTLASSKIGKEAGYVNPDELLTEMRYLAPKSFNGFIFDSYAAHVADATGSTNVITQHLNGQIGADQELRELSVSSPSSQNVTVYTSSIRFSGKSDPLFPISLDGKTLERNSIGGFSVTLELKLGINKFTVEHKGRTIVYTVTYKYVLFKEVSPTGSTKLPGGAALGVTAQARRGATLTASLGDKNVQLTQVDSIIDGADKNEFVEFVGSFSLPAATDKEQNLGAIKFKATYSGQSETKNGATVYVNKGNVNSVTKGTVAEVTYFEAETFNGGGSTDEYSRPTNSFLPQGTVDWCAASPVVVGKTKTRLLNCGVRVFEYQDSKYGKTTFIKTEAGSLPDTNTITVAGVSTEGRHTKITFDTNWKAPFLVDYQPQAYPKNSSTVRDYTVNSATFTYVDIKFCYAALGSGKIELGDNTAFKSAEWIKSGANHILRLHLRKAGAFYGWIGEYNDKGQLELSFLNPIKISGTSLAGVKVLLDPGHDAVMVGASGAGGREEVSVMKLSKRIQQRINSKGGECVLTHGEDGKYYSLLDRKKISKRERANLFLSVHRNDSSSSSSKGLENYYFYPWSKLFGEHLRTSELPFWKTDRGTKWQPFGVITQPYSPAVLTEEGFINNLHDSGLMSDTNMDKNADLIVEGIINFLKTQ